MIKHSLLLSILFVNSIISDQGSLSNQGFVQGTLVKTIAGYTAIETINPGEFVYCAGKNGSYQQPVKAVSQHRTNSVIVIKVGENKILCGPKHLFYLPQEGRWEQAQNLTSEHVLTNFQQEHVPIDSVTTLNTPAELFDLTVDKHHKFYVSEQNLVVHNFPVGVLLFAVPAVSAVVKGVTAVGVAALGWKISKSFEKQKQENRYQQMESNAERSHHSTKAQTIQKPQTDSKKIAPLSIDQKNVKHIETTRSLKRKNTKSVEQAKQHGRDKQKNQVQETNQSQQAQPPVKPPEDPKEDDKEKRKVKISQDDWHHIFRNDEGHLPYTPENQELLIDTASNMKNYLETDKFGTEWYAKILPNGKQVWVTVRNGLIRNGGLNKIQKTVNPGNGLCQSMPIRRK